MSPVRFPGLLGRQAVPEEVEMGAEEELNLPVVRMVWQALSVLHYSVRMGSKVSGH